MINTPVEQRRRVASALWRARLEATHLVTRLRAKTGASSLVAVLRARTLAIDEALEQEANMSVKEIRLEAEMDARDPANKALGETLAVRWGTLRAEQVQLLARLQAELRAVARAQKLLELRLNQSFL